MVIKKEIKNIKIFKPSETLEEIKSDFITIASHQLRTPISAIRWSLDTLLSGKAGKISAKQEELINQAYQNNSFMIKVVNDLLRVARIEEKGVRLDFQRVDLKSLVKQAIERVKSFSRAFNCRIILKAQSSLPTVYTDPLQIKVVVEGLIDNAIRYGRRQSKIININLKKIGQKVLFEIKDSGIGIPLSQQPLVFSKFFRAVNAIKAQTQGLGLDLYIIKKIIEAAGGEIWFESIENQGATFYFTLPIKKITPKFLVGGGKKAIRIDEDELNYFYRNISDGLIIVDRNQKIIRLNPVAEKFLGVNQKEVRGQNINKVILNSEMVKILKNKNKIKTLIHLELERKGQFFRMVIFPVKTKNKIEGWVIILHDVSQKTPEIAGVDETLKKEREFVAITVHELKSPLGITKWSLEMLESENLGKLNSAQRELIKQIYRGNERLLVLVRDLLNLSKLQEGRFEVKSKPITIEKVISDTLIGFKPQTKKRKIKLIWQKSKKKIPKVLADASRTAQIITNLVSNAVKYTPENGKVIITVKKVSSKNLEKISKELSTAKILHTKNKKGYLAVSVKDTGIGIAEEEQKKLFSRFFRGKNVLKSKVEGTGLGLYIAKSIINLQKGDIWFESVLGKGSKFYFSLPLT